MKRSFERVGGDISLGGNDNISPAETPAVLEHNLGAGVF
jgi:hypothetical protein